MTSFPRSMMSVLIATSLLAGCGDDEGGFTNETTADAGGTSSASGEPSSSTTTSNPTPTEDTADTEVNDTSADDTSTDETGADETTASEPDSTDDATQGSALDGGDGPAPSEQDGSVTDDDNAGDNDGGVTVPADDASSPGSSETTGAPACGAEGDVCCSAGGGFGGGGQGTCDEGLVCNNPQGNGLTDSECVVETPVTVDAGDVTSAPACGAEGDVCCSAGGGFGGGGQGTCDEGLVCNNPQGNGLTDSECVVETPVTSDAGDTSAATADAGDVTSAAACGAEGEVCCAASGGGGFGGGGQGTCDEGLTCDNPAGGGLTNSECVAP